MIKLIVFLPLLAAIVAGLGNRALGNFAAKSTDPDDNDVLHVRSAFGVCTVNGRPTALH